MNNNKNSEMVDRALLKYFEKHSKYPSCVQLSASDYRKFELQKAGTYKGVRLEQNSLLEDGNIYLID